MKKDLIVVGTGPAGMTAGMYGLRRGLETLVLDKGICGGLSNELEEVKKVESKAEEMTVITEKDTYQTKAVVISTGTKHRKLGVKGEDEYLGRGISYCATCDGFFFRNKHVMVVGGGDSAVREALYLKNIGCVVTLIHRSGLATQMGIKMDKSGYIITDKRQRTNIKRVYAAGDITGGVRQIVVACAEGAIAATSAYDDLLS